MNDEKLNTALDQRCAPQPGGWLPCDRDILDRYYCRTHRRRPFLVGCSRYIRCTDDRWLVSPGDPCRLSRQRRLTLSIFW